MIYFLLTLNIAFHLAMKQPYSCKTYYLATIQVSLQRCGIIASDKGRLGKSPTRCNPFTALSIQEEIALSIQTNIWINNILIMSGPNYKKG